MTVSLISEDLVSAYRAANYRVFCDEQFVLKIDQRSQKLIALHRAHKCDCSAFITAFNPFSAPTSPAENEEAQQLLEKQLSERSLQFIKGAGEDSAGKWPSENSALVLGVSLEIAKAIVVEFLHNAIIWSAADGTPKLILLR